MSSATKLLPASVDAFVYVEVQELREVGFVAGEITQLKVGIAEWCKV